jgi:hypothetical protein
MNVFYIKLKLCNLCLHVCSLIAQDRINGFIPNLRAHSLRPVREHKRVKSLDEVPRVWFSIIVVPVAQKRTKIKRQRKDHSCCIERKITKKMPKLREAVLCSIPDKYSFCSSGSKHNRRTVVGFKIVCSEEIIETRVATPKTVLVSITVKDV